MPFRYPEPDFDYGVGLDTVGRFTACGWALLARCDAGHEKRLGSDFLAALPAEALMRDVAARLKCDCGQRDGLAYAINAPGTGYGPSTVRA